MQEASFYWWRRRLAEDEAVRLAPAFVPVRLAENSATHAEPEIEIFLAREPRVRVRGLVNRQILSDVLAVMAEHLGPDGGRASTSVGEVEPC